MIDASLKHLLLELVNLLLKLLLFLQHSFNLLHKFFLWLNLQSQSELNVYFFDRKELLENLKLLLVHIFSANKDMPLLATLHDLIL